MKSLKSLYSFIIISFTIISCSNNTVVTTGECIVPKYPPGPNTHSTDIRFPDKFYIEKYKVIDSAIYYEVYTDDNLYYQSENIYTHKKNILTDANNMRSLILSNPFKSNRIIGFVRLERKITENLYLFAYNFNLDGVDTLGSSGKVRFDFALYDVINNKVLDINYGDFYNYIGFQSFPTLTFEYVNNDIYINVIAGDILQYLRFNTNDNLNIRTSLFNKRITRNYEELKFLSKSKIIKAVPLVKNNDYDYKLINNLNGFSVISKQDSIYLDRDILVTEDDSLYVSGFVYNITKTHENYFYIQNLFTQKLEIVNITDKYCLYSLNNLQLLNNEEIIFQAAYIPDFKYYLYKYNMKTKVLSKIDLVL